MTNILKKTFKATIIQIIVALFSTVFIFICVYLLLGQEIKYVISLIDKVSIDTKNIIETVTVVTEQI